MTYLNCSYLSCTIFFNLKDNIHFQIVFPNIYRGDKVPSFVPSECYSGLLQPLDLSMLTDWAEHSLLLRMWYNTYYHQHLCGKFLWPLHLGWLFVLDLYIKVYDRCLNACSFDCTTIAWSGKVGSLNLGFNTPVGWLLSSQLTVLHCKSVRDRMKTICV